MGLVEGTLSDEEENETENVMEIDTTRRTS